MQISESQLRLIIREEILEENKREPGPHPRSYGAPEGSKRDDMLDQTKADLASGDPEREKRAWARRDRMEKKEREKSGWMNKPRSDTKNETLTLDEEELLTYVHEVLSKKLKATLRKKAEDRGLTPGSVEAEYKKGLAAWGTSGSRPGISQHAWAMARVNAATPSKDWAVVKKSKTKRKIEERTVRITERQLRRIIRQEVKALREAAGSYSGNVTPDEAVVLDFLTAGDADGAAGAIMDMISDPHDAASTLEGFFEIGSEAGVTFPPGVINRAHNALDKLVMQSDRGAMENSPEAPTLNVIAASMGMSSISPADVRYMTFQPRRSGAAGAIKSVSVVYKNPDSGSSYSNVLPGDVERAGITFEEFMAGVQRLGAKSRARGPAMKRNLPYYD